jgi:hypothetical protein
MDNEQINTQRQPGKRIIRPVTTLRALDRESFPTLAREILSQWSYNSPWEDDREDNSYVNPPDEIDNYEIDPDDVSIPSTPSSQDLFGTRVRTPQGRQIMDPRDEESSSSESESDTNPSNTPAENEGSNSESSDQQPEQQSSQEERGDAPTPSPEPENRPQLPSSSPHTANMSSRRGAADGTIHAGGNIEIPDINMGATKLDSFVKLEGRENFHAWKLNMSTVLEMCNAYELTVGRTLEREEQVPAHLKTKWHTAQRRGVLLMRNSLSVVQNQSTEHVKTIGEMFTWADKEYNQEGVTSLLQLSTRWEAATIENFPTARKLADEIRAIQEGYAKVGAEHKLPNSHLTVHFVRGLGEDFKAWTQVFWTSVGNVIPPLADVVPTVEAEETRMGRTDQSLSDNVPGMVAKTGTGRGRKRAPTKTPLEEESESVTFRKPKCSHCGKIGHVSLGCWDLHPELRKKFIERRDKQKKKDRDTKKALLSNHPKSDSDSDMGETI